MKNRLPAGSRKSVALLESLPVSGKTGEPAKRTRKREERNALPVGNTGKHSVRLPKPNRFRKRRREHRKIRKNIPGLKPALQDGVSPETAFAVNMAESGAAKTARRTVTAGVDGFLRKNLSKRRKNQMQKLKSFVNQPPKHS